MSAGHPNVRSNGRYNSVVAGRHGKPEAFTPEENEVFRRLLRQLIKDQGLSQAQAGERLHVAQQTVAKLVGPRGTGFSLPTARRLAAALGASGPEELLARETAAGDGVPWAGREAAVLLARRVPYDERVIDRVVSRFSADTYAHRPTRWWLELIVHEAAFAVAEHDTPTPPPTSVLATRGTADRSSGVERVATGERGR